MPSKKEEKTIEARVSVPGEAGISFRTECLETPKTDQEK
jgi:hypothetical protein